VGGDLREATSGEALGLPNLLPMRDDVVELLVANHATARLGAHLRLVFDVACQLSNWVTSAWPSLSVDHELVSFGGATHDIGKALHIDELSGPGTRHEVAGRTMLESLGVPPHRARFAVTHNAWLAEGIEIEDLLVATADKIWKGRREEPLEHLLVSQLAASVKLERWVVFATLDDELQLLADEAPARLYFQSQWSVTAM
jgi:HD domain